jgi:hypothetical protein
MFVLLWLPFYSNHLRFVLALNYIYDFKVLEVVEQDVSLFGAANDILTIWWDTKLWVVWSQSKQVVLKSLNELSLSYVPHLNSVIPRRWDDIVFVWCHSYTGNWIWVSIFKLEDGVFLLYIPDFNLTIFVSWNHESLRSRDVHVVARRVAVDDLVNVAVLYLIVESNDAVTTFFDE